MVSCKICPRQCGAERTPESPGFCGVEEGFSRFRIGQMMLHRWEEPHLGGGPDGPGVGNIFFVGCSLRCVFCQNMVISQGREGKLLDVAALSDSICELQQKGAMAIGFVTPEHYVLTLLPLLQKLKRDSFPLPLIWNTGSYQKVDTLKRLEGLIDIYLPDVKYKNSRLSTYLSQAPDYWEVAREALEEMRRQQPQQIYSADGILKKGVSIRHLILPGQYKDSQDVLTDLAQGGWLHHPLALMSQYTPEFYIKNPVLQGGDPVSVKLNRHLQRRLTQFEYDKVVDHALKLGFTNLLGQDRNSASAEYTPAFWSREEYEA